MSKELEEILDRWKLYISLTKNFSNKDMELLKIEEIEELLDYISNLQQENKQLKERIKKVEDYASKVGDRRNELYDKIDKAIEYIKSYLPNYDFDNSNLEKLLEILGEKE